MSSLTFFLAFCKPRKQNISNATSPSLSPKILDTTDNPQPQPAIRISPHIYSNNSTSGKTAPLFKAKNISPNLWGRREVIATGVCGAILGILRQPKLEAATEESPCKFTVSPSGLAFCDKRIGVGPQAASGQLIKVHYVGELENGKVFDSSYNRGKPLIFRVGVGEVIKGWDQGILGTEGVPPMLAGGKRRLRIPPKLGYGMRGAGCKGGTCIIPPDSVLFFNVEFIGTA